MQCVYMSLLLIEAFLINVVLMVAGEDGECVYMSLLLIEAFLINVVLMVVGEDGGGGAGM